MGGKELVIESLNEASLLQKEIDFFKKNVPRVSLPSGLKYL